jgi:hypothetical protein
MIGQAATYTRQRRNQKYKQKTSSSHGNIRDIYDRYPYVIPWDEWSTRSQ